MRSKELIKMSEEFVKMAQQAPSQWTPQVPNQIPNSQFRTDAVQFFGDLNVNQLGFLFGNIPPQKVVQDIKQSVIDDNEIRAIANRYLAVIQKQMNFLNEFKDRASQLISGK